MTTFMDLSSKSSSISHVIKLEIMCSVEKQLTRLVVNFPKSTFEAMNSDLLKEAKRLSLLGLPPYDIKRPFLSPVHEKARKFMKGIVQEIFKDKIVDDVHKVSIVRDSPHIITKL